MKLGKGANPRARWRLAHALCISMAVFAASGGSVSATTATTQAELLEAEKAFPVTARQVGGNAVELRYAIVDGYYLYRDRFRFAINGQPVALANKAWPRGKWKQDATFGKVVTYRKSVRVLLPISPATRSATRSARESLTLTASSQGCADAGVCYPPLHQTLILPTDSSAWVSPQKEVVSGFSRDRSPVSGLADRLTNGK